MYINIITIHITAILNFPIINIIYRILVLLEPIWNNCFQLTIYHGRYQVQHVPQ